MDCLTFIELFLSKSWQGYEVIFSDSIWLKLFSFFLLLFLASFKTKDTLKEEDIQLTREVTVLEHRYKEVYRAVASLSAKYSDCKDHNAVSRYGDLKEMIKACVTDEMMEKVNECCNDVMLSSECKGKAASMLAASKKLSQLSRSAAEKENGLSIQYCHVLPVDL